MLSATLIFSFLPGLACTPSNSRLNPFEIKRPQKCGFHRHGWTARQRNLKPSTVTHSTGILLLTCGWERVCFKVRRLVCWKTGMPVQPMVCLRCRREIETGQKSVAVYMFAQTVGVKPRQKSGAQRICFCPQCAVSLAMGMPPEGALNMAAWDMIRDLVSSEPSLNEAAWESLRGVIGLLGAGDDSAEVRARVRRAG